MNRRDSDGLLCAGADAARIGLFDWDLVGERIICSKFLQGLWGFARGEHDLRVEA